MFKELTPEQKEKHRRQFYNYIGKKAMTGITPGVPKSELEQPGFRPPGKEVEDEDIWFYQDFFGESILVPPGTKLVVNGNKLLVSFSKKHLAKFNQQELIEMLDALIVEFSSHLDREGLLKEMLNLTEDGRGWNASFALRQRMKIV